MLCLGISFSAVGVNWPILWGAYVNVSHFILCGWLLGCAWIAWGLGNNCILPNMQNLRVVGCEKWWNRKM